MDDNKRLDDSNLEGVAGGVIFNASNISGADSNNPWEILDDHTGNNIYIDGKKLTYRTKEEAIAAINRLAQDNPNFKNSVNTMEVNWDQVLSMRGLK